MYPLILGSNSLILRSYPLNFEYMSNIFGNVLSPLYFAETQLKYAKSHLEISEKPPNRLTSRNSWKNNLKFADNYLKLVEDHLELVRYAANISSGR